MNNAFDELRDQLWAELDELRQRRRVSKSLGTPRHSRPARPMPELIREMDVLAKCYGAQTERLTQIAKNSHRPSKAEVRAALDSFNFRVCKAFSDGQIGADEVARLEARRIQIANGLARRGLI